MAERVQIDGRRIAPSEPMYVIAELSANHHQDLDVAKDMVKAAASAGVDAVKLQTYTPDTLTIDSDQPWFRVQEGSLWEGRTLYDLYQEASTPWEWHEELFETARQMGMHAFSTPFDTSAVDFLEDLGCPAYKIASFECVDLELIEYVAATGKPMIISTGMATAQEIGDALAAARRGGCMDVALLRCNSAYPSPPEEMDLRTILDMQERFGVPIGLSDHTLGPEAALAARALGGCILEKHFVLDRDEEGPDTAFSMEPDALAAMVSSIRTLEKTLGAVRYGPSEHEQASLLFRRSLFVVADVAAGETLTRENVRAIRPGHGLAPRHIGDVLGRKMKKDVPRGTPLGWEHLE